MRGNDGKECGKVLHTGVWLVDSLADMALALPREARVVAALGSRGLAALRARPDLHLHARMLMPPAFTPPPRWRLLRGRKAGAPRGSLAREMAWLRATRAQWVVARQSAGSHALVCAAMQLGLCVLMQRRPPPPAGVLVLHDTAAVVAWMIQQRAQPFRDAEVP